MSIQRQIVLGVVQLILFLSGLFVICSACRPGNDDVVEHTSDDRGGFIEKAVTDRLIHESPTHFLEDFLEEKKANVNPVELQQWAIGLLDDWDTEKLHRTVSLDELPASLRPGFKRSLVGITAFKGAAESDRYVCFIYGGSLGWHGIKVGREDFRPVDEDATHVEWTPGVYAYFLPPY